MSPAPRGSTSVYRLIAEPITTARFYRPMRHGDIRGLPMRTLISGVALLRLFVLYLCATDDSSAGDGFEAGGEIRQVGVSSRFGRRRDIFCPSKECARIASTDPTTVGEYVDREPDTARPMR